MNIVFPKLERILSIYLSRQEHLDNPLLRYIVCNMFGHFFVFLQNKIMLPRRFLIHLLLMQVSSDPQLPKNALWFSFGFEASTIPHIKDSFLTETKQFNPLQWFHYNFITEYSALVSFLGKHPLKLTWLTITMQNIFGCSLVPNTMMIWRTWKFNQWPTFCIFITYKNDKLCQVIDRVI